jgi:homoserine kinase
MEREISVVSPASIANLSSGFDVCGIAIEGLGDELTISYSNQQQLSFTVVGEHGLEVPTAPERNAATVPILAFCKEHNIPPHFRVVLHKRMPIGSGLGSSGSSAAAGVFAVNELLELKKSKQELLRYAVEGERIACGAGHADNVAASLYGGAVVVSSYDPLTVISVPVANPNLHLAVVHPHIVLKTQDSRDVLPQSLPLKTAVAQLGAFGGLLVGLMTGNNDYLRAGLTDHIAEPHRARLIRGFTEARLLALETRSTLGFGIAGSGPSMFAVCEDVNAATNVCTRLRDLFTRMSIEVTTISSKIDQHGCRVTERK